MFSLRKSKNELLLLKVNVDYSPHEIAWAEILHREIFEDGTYFKKLDINLTKGRKPVRASRDCSEEKDEGFEEGLSSNPYVKMNQITSRDYLDQLNE